MSEDLQGLLEEINRDGVEKANAEAARIVDAAKRFIEGANKVLEEKAEVPEAKDDIFRRALAVLGEDTPDLKSLSKAVAELAAADGERPMEKVAQKLRIPKNKENLKAQRDKKVIDKELSSPYIDVNDILPKLSEEERAIVNALKDGQRLVDDVIAETGLTTGKVLANLTMLELKGIIKRHPGKQISLK